MEFNLKEIEKWAKEFKPLPTKIGFLDNRIEEMRNPEGYVADYYNFFYTLARDLEPKVIVELGSWQGTSAACFSLGSPESLVITIDHHTDPGDTLNKQKTHEACNASPGLMYIQDGLAHSFTKKKRTSTPFLVKVHILLCLIYWTAGK